MAEYLALERTSHEKHALWDGAVFAMAGASPRHNLLVAAILRELGNGLLGKPCRPFASDQRIRIPGAARYLYPDASVVCPPFEIDPEDDATIQNPKLIAEVLSPSTEAFDRGDKFIAYRSIASLSDYLLFSQDEPRVEHFTREGGGVWRLVTLGRGDRLSIASLEVELAMADLHAGLA